MDKKEPLPPPPPLDTGVRDPDWPGSNPVLPFTGPRAGHLPTVQSGHDDSGVSVVRNKLGDKRPVRTEVQRRDDLHPLAWPAGFWKSTSAGCP